MARCFPNSSSAEEYPRAASHAGFTSRIWPYESQRQMPYGAFVTRERKLISDRRRLSWVARSAALSQQIRIARTKNKARRIMVEWNCAAFCRVENAKYALTVSAKEVATNPGFHPPYQALTMTATAKTASRLSAMFGNSRAGIRASVVLSTATRKRRKGARVGLMLSRA